MPSLTHVLWNSLWQVIQSLLPFPPIYAAYGIGCILALSLATGIWMQITGRVKFTLEPVEFHKIDRSEDV